MRDVQAVLWRLRWWVPTASELRSAYFDVRARLGGWCNDCPGYAGGKDYGRWRCESKRGHPDPHRHGNFAWDNGGAPQLQPPLISLNGYTLHLFSPWTTQHAGGSWWHRMRWVAPSAARVEAAS